MGNYIKHRLLAFLDSYGEVTLPYGGGVSAAVEESRHPAYYCHLT